MVDCDSTVSEYESDDDGETGDEEEDEEEEEDNASDSDSDNHECTTPAAAPLASRDRFAVKGRLCLAGTPDTPGALRNWGAAGDSADSAAANSAFNTAAWLESPTLRLSRHLNLPPARRHHSGGGDSAVDSMLDLLDQAAAASPLKSRSRVMAAAEASKQQQQKDAAAAAASASAAEVTCCVCYDHIPADDRLFLRCWRCCSDFHGGAVRVDLALSPS